MNKLVDRLHQQGFEDGAKVMLEAALERFLWRAQKFHEQSGVHQEGSFRICPATTCAAVNKVLLSEELGNP